MGWAREMIRMAGRVGWTTKLRFAGSCARYVGGQRASPRALLKSTCILGDWTTTDLKCCSRWAVLRRSWSQNNAIWASDGGWESFSFASGTSVTVRNSAAFDDEAWWGREQLRRVAAHGESATTW